MLELLEGKLSRAVLRGLDGGNAVRLPGTQAWLSKCRGILVRYEKKAENYLALVQLACALLWYRRLAYSSF